VNGKPAPDIYLHAAQATGHPPDACIVIEDSRHGIAGARVAGMTTVGFAGGGHATEGLVQELRDAGASIVISHMRALPRALQSLCDRKEHGT
jgi:beta-phosphoglucomutase-like phosphatase (HAD superfamily)